MAVKHQFQMIKNPRHLIMVTLNHLDAMQDYATNQTTKTNILVTYELLINVSTNNSPYVHASYVLRKTISLRVFVHRRIATYQLVSFNPFDTLCWTFCKTTEYEFLASLTVTYNIQTRLLSSLRPLDFIKVNYISLWDAYVDLFIEKWF